MKLPRRNFLQLVAGAAALPTVPRFAWAQAYPTRPAARQNEVGLAARATPSCRAPAPAPPCALPAPRSRAARRPPPWRALARGARRHRGHCCAALCKERAFFAQSHSM